MRSTRQRSRPRCRLYAFRPSPWSVRRLLPRTLPPTTMSSGIIFYVKLSSISTLFLATALYSLKIKPPRMIVRCWSPTPDTSTNLLAQLIHVFQFSEHAYFRHRRWADGRYRLLKKAFLLPPTHLHILRAFSTPTFCFDDIAHTLYAFIKFCELIVCFDDRLVAPIYHLFSLMPHNRLLSDRRQEQVRLSMCRSRRGLMEFRHFLYRRHLFLNTHHHDCINISHLM